MIDQFYTETELTRIFTNIQRKGISDAMYGALIKHCYNRPVNLRTSGFFYVGGIDAVMSWDNATRTITLTPFIPDPLPYDKNGNLYKPHFRFYSWYKGPVLHQKYQTESVQVPAEEGLFLICFVLDQATRLYKLSYIKNPSVFQKAEVYVYGIPVAWVYWDATAGSAIYFGDSRHGSEWNPQMHWMWHNTLNSVRETGIAIVDAIYDGDGSLDAHFQFGISAGKLCHEDINAEAPAVGKATEIPVWYIDGGVPRFSTQTGKKFLNAGRVGYSSGSGITQATHEWFVLYHLFVTNCRLNQHISVVGQQYETLPMAAANIDAEVSTIRQQMPHSNMMHIGSIVLQTSDDYTNSAKARIVTIVQGIQTEMSVVGDGTPINKVRLKNDVENPGNLHYYGTNELGVKTYHPLPAFSEIKTEKHIVGTGKDADKVRLFGDVARPITEKNKYYGTKDGSDETFHPLPEEAVQYLTGLTPAFDLELGRGAAITLDGDTTISFLNLKDNDTGHIEVSQGTGGGHTLHVEAPAGVTVQIAANCYEAPGQVKLTGMDPSKDIVVYWFSNNSLKIAVVYNVLA